MYNSKYGEVSRVAEVPQERYFINRMLQPNVIQLKAIGSIGLNPCGNRTPQVLLRVLFFFTHKDTKYTKGDSAKGMMGFILCVLCAFVFHYSLFTIH